MQSSLYTVARDSLDVLASVSFDVDLYPERPVAKAADFFALLRSNLHAGALHAAMGHEGSRFRECPRPACLDAARLIPRLEEVEPGTTDAELGTILDQVKAELETSLLKACYAAMM
ncbi:MAG TPA: hypothetical protein VI669_04715 [Vicinamibacteria bacterium]